MKVNLSFERLSSLTLSETEQRVVDYLTKQSTVAAQQTIGEVAQASRVSQPTVARVSQRLGFSGWRELRTWMALSIGAQTPFNQSPIGKKDAPIQVMEKVIDRSMATLAQLKTEFETLPSSVAGFGKAVEHLSVAKRIEFYGQGNSGIAAADGAHKFFRLGCHAVAYSDPHLHSVAAVSLTKHDVVVALSNSGKSPLLCQSLGLARSSGAAVIALTVPRSPVALVADLVLPVPPSDDPDLFAPMTARVAQLVLLDALAVATAHRLGEPVRKRLARGREVLAKQRN
jgi:RpiR family transcriptional regulator, carbohydrate utilization regulator